MSIHSFEIFELVENVCPGKKGYCDDIQAIFKDPLKQALSTKDGLLLSLTRPETALGFDLSLGAIRDTEIEIPDNPRELDLFLRRSDKEIDIVLPGFVQPLSENVHQNLKWWVVTALENPRPKREFVAKRIGGILRPAFVRPENVLQLGNR